MNKLDMNTQKEKAGIAMKMESILLKIKSLKKKSMPLKKKLLPDFNMVEISETASCLLLFILLQSSMTAQDGSGIITDIKARFSSGQVFITWKEAPAADGTTFNVYASNSPINNDTLKNAEKLAHHIEPHSSRNWWRNPSSFRKDAQAVPSIGFIIKSGEPPLDPSGGLFVHTPNEKNVKLSYYAVTYSSPDGIENLKIIPGVNSLSSNVRQSVMPIDAIWQTASNEPQKGTQGDALFLSLHSFTAGRFTDDAVYIVFGLAEHGWREGLPFVFKVSREPGQVIIRPSNNFFTGPGMTASRDQVLSIVNFWYGYNEFIYDSPKMKNGRIFNYSEKILLWLREWAVRKYSVNPNKVYLQGSSMGGSGAVSNSIHHPTEYAAAYAHVPVVSYTKSKGDSASHLEPFCGKNLEIMCNEGILLLERMNGENIVRKSHETFPFLFLLNGRQDTAIPWGNNPGFYRALDESRQGYMAYWDNGRHDTAGVDAPEDVRLWKDDKWFSQFSLDRSFPAFSNCSTNKNPGNGEKTDGDITGWMNRGMSWEAVEDEQAHYAITVKAFYPGMQYPVIVDVTPRRLQQFKPSPGENLSVSLSNGASGGITVDKSGLFTIKKLSISSEKGVRLVISRTKK